MKDLNKSYIYDKKQGNLCIFSIQHTSLNFYKLLPFFESRTFYTRKFTFFQLWSIVLKLKMAGYHQSVEGSSLIDKIINSMNNASYSNSYNKVTIPTVEEMNNIILNNSYSTMNKDSGLNI